MVEACFGQTTIFQMNSKNGWSKLMFQIWVGKNKGRGLLKGIGKAGWNEYVYRVVGEENRVIMATKDTSCQNCQYIELLPKLPVFTSMIWH